MMKHTTKRHLLHMARLRVHGLVILSCLVLALLGSMPESSGGWVSWPPAVTSALVTRPGRHRAKSGRERRFGRVGGTGAWVRATWHLPLLRSLTLGSVWLLSGRWELMWLSGLPWLVWLGQNTGQLWPGLRCKPEWRVMNWLAWHAQGLAWAAGLGLLLGQVLNATMDGVIQTTGWGGDGSAPLALGLGCVVCGRDGNWVNVERQADGSYQAELCGHFRLQVAGDEPFRIRLLWLFLRLLEEPGRQRRGCRTMDGRTPFVAQMQIAAWFDLPQPNVSRIEGYWREGDWANLLSLCAAEVLAAELRQRIVAVFATHPWWTMQAVYEHLHVHGVKATYDQVCQAARESGWCQLRETLGQRYHFSAEDFRPRDGWLVQQVLALQEQLMARLEALGGLTPEEHLAVDEVQALATEVGVAMPLPLKALPWMLRVEQVLFGTWQAVEDDQVRCIYCGSTQVVRKSKRPRLKRYYDAEGHLQGVEVYRYYCRNQACDRGSFTNLPPGLVPYSRYRTEVKLRAVQMTAWSYSTYRRTGQALGVQGMTVYRWVSAWGYELLPVASLFGVVRSSGVVGVDEKYVLVPKNDKPDGKMRRWMYVYLAVDVYTYDLLHIAIYANNDKDTALTFLLALRAKGYHPRVVVTDLRRDYGNDIARVFPQATHHECIFHALKDVSRSCRDTYGKYDAETQPEVEQLRQAIQAIFAAKTKRTAQKRYAAVMALREQYVHDKPQAAAIFDFLERHWPKLVNGIESQVIPRTNNAVELVIRRFDQHYQNFCGFESIETAQIYLGVFEKLYRLTPFSEDAQPRIRGKCPLELAGYDLSRLPLASLWNGLSVEWPMQAPHAIVPNR
jgi:transposase-like protein